MFLSHGVWHAGEGGGELGAATPKQEWSFRKQRTPESARHLAADLYPCNMCRCEFRAVNQPYFPSCQDIGKARFVSKNPFLWFGGFVGFAANLFQFFGF